VKSTFVTSLGSEADFVAVSPAPEPAVLGLVAAGLLVFPRRRNR